MNKADFTIGRLSRDAGVNIETIRYYERIGLMPKAVRASGRRLYQASDIRRLSFIRRGRELGFSIEDIRALLKMADGAGSCAKAHDLTLRHLEEIHAKIKDLRRMRRVLSRTAERCRKDASLECPIIDALTAF